MEGGDDIQVVPWGCCEVVHTQVFWGGGGVGANGLLSEDGCLHLEVAGYSQDGRWELFSDLGNCFGEFRDYGLLIVVLDVVDIAECYIGVFCFERGHDTLAVSCGCSVDQCMDEGLGNECDIVLSVCYDCGVVEEFVMCIGTGCTPGGFGGFLEHENVNLQGVCYVLNPCGVVLFCHI